MLARVDQGVSPGKSGLVAALVLLLCPCMPGAPARANPAVPTVPPPLGALHSDGTETDDAVFASPTRLDRIGRVQAPVMINGSGPFRFIIDTAASRSTISPQLAATLGLDPALERTILVNGITGSGEVPSVPVALLQAGDFELRDSHFPVVCAPPSECADGILGVAGLTSERIVIDFQHDRVAILRSRKQGAPLGFFAIPATRLEGGLLAIPAKIGGIRVQAIIDTGSERTLGNPALQAALRRRTRDLAAHMTTVYGATAETSDGLIQDAPPIEFKTATITNTSIIFGDFHIFDVWKLHSEPALIVGMDVLGTLRTLVLDFRESEVYIDSRARADVSKEARAGSQDWPLRLNAHDALSRR